jgi:hypothetical protein
LKTFSLVRLLLSVSLAAVALGAAAAGAQSGPGARLDSPRAAEIADWSSFKDSTLVRTSKALTIPPTWPPYELTTTSGEPVSIRVSKSFADDRERAQQWANFFGSLIHGSELSSLTAYFMSAGEVQSVCGRGALACYGGNTIIAPAQDPSFDLSAEAVVTHEYGHHVAAHRLNTPWEAIDYGTKRWASYERVCSKARSGQLVPGAEDDADYQLNPGEGFAESYRVLNERRAGLLEPAWDIVTNLLYPNAQALDLIEQDVLSPWTKQSTVTRTGSVKKRSPARSFVVSTPLDGTLRVTLRSSAQARFRLTVLRPSSARLASATGRNASLAARVCGDRALRVRVSRVSGAGAFRLAISKP